MTETKPVPLWNIANILTMVRIVMVPLFAWVLVAGWDNAWGRIAAFVIFGAAMYTDHLDGHLARTRGLITDFGKLMDPIADKAIIGAALIILSCFGVVWWWVTIVIMVREIGITIMRMTVLRYGVIPASQGGKLKTVTQTAAIGFFVLPLEKLWQPLIWIPRAFIAAALILTVWTGVEYLVHGMRLRKEALSR